MKELENKIREALPRLKELNKGCIIDSKYYGIAELIHYDKDYFNYLFVDSKLQYRSDNEKQIEVIGHPIKLNDVLEYFLDFRKYSTKDSQIQEFLNIWDLSSVFLVGQSEEFINFLNEL